MRRTARKRSQTGAFSRCSWWFWAVIGGIRVRRAPPGPLSTPQRPRTGRKGPPPALRSGSGGKRGRQMASKGRLSLPTTSSTWKNDPRSTFRGRFPSSRTWPASAWRSSGGPGLSRFPIGSIGSTGDPGQLPPPRWRCRADGFRARFGPSAVGSAVGSAVKSAVGSAGPNAAASGGLP